MRNLYLIILCLALSPLTNRAQNSTEQKGSTYYLNKFKPVDDKRLNDTIEQPSDPPHRKRPNQDTPTEEKYSVGSPICSFNVSNSGAAVYDIKIDVPEGGTITPRLSLTYNSQSGGYGLAGYGVNLSGLSIITTGGKSLFYDGEQRGVNYRNEDTYFLDGKRLILKENRSGAQGVEYTVEGDPYTHVYRYSRRSGRITDIWYKVITADGTTYEYGKSYLHRMFHRGRNDTRIFVWYLQSAEDKYGNKQQWDYVNYGVLNKVPSSVSYTTSNGKSAKISFSYKSLGDNARPFMVSDNHCQFDVCLSKINISIGNETYRVYTLKYDDKLDESQTKWSRLVSVYEENGKGEKFPPVVLSWEKLPGGDMQASQLDAKTNDGRSYVIEEGKSFFAADLNGDGVSDIIRISPVRVIYWKGYGSEMSNYYTYIYVSRSKMSSSGNVSYEEPLIYTIPASISLGDIKSALGGVSVMDFDGDGYNDFIIPQQNKVDGQWNEVNCYVVFGSDVVAGNTGNTKIFSVKLHETDRVPLFATFDTDGNGKDDVVCLEQHQHNGYYPCTVVKYDGGTKLDRKEYKLLLAKEPQKLFVGDYNNDGLSDLIVLYDGGYKIYFNTGGKPTDDKFTENNTAEGTNFGNRWRVQQGDFDGDGLIDFVYNFGNGDRNLWISFNNGDGTFANINAADITISDHNTCKDDDKFSIITWDMDNDGRTDVMVCKAGYRHRGFPKFKNEYTRTEIKWLRSTGKNLVLRQLSSKGREEDALENSIFLGDFDGDGQMELANYGSKFNSGDDGFNGKINVYKIGKDLTGAGRVTHMYDGFGTEHAVQYAFATTPNVYKRTISSHYPVNTYALPIPVVRQVQSDNGQAGILSTTYNYEDMRLHIAGRGMLGFNKVTSTNTTLDVKTTKEITKWDEQRWIPLEAIETVETKGGSSSSLSCSTIATVDNNYFAYISRQEHVDMDGNRTTTLATYDTDKGVPAEEIVKNDGDNMYRKVVYGDYVKVLERWLPTTMVKTQKHKDDPTPYATTTKYTYDDKGNVLSITANSDTELALTTTNTYNQYGKVLTSVTTGKDVKPITKHNEYDPNERLVVKTYTTPETSVNTFTYDTWGNLLTQTDITNPDEPLTTTYIYDDWGREKEAVEVDGARMEHKNDWFTKTNKKGTHHVTTTGTDSPPVQIVYDKMGREMEKISKGPKNVSIIKETSYNNKGQVSQIKNTTGKLVITQKFDYDDRGRIIKETLSSGKTISYAYGNRTVTSTIAETGQSVTKNYDAWGNVIKVEDPSGVVVYKYASVGKPSSVTAHESTVSMTYDVAGNQISLADPDAGTSTYTYAADGTLLTQTDGKGIKTTYQFDGLGRLSTTTSGDSISSTIYGGTYVNGHALIMTKKTKNCLVSYGYDKFGRVTSEDRYMNGKSYKFAYSYNKGGQLSKVTYPGGMEVDYCYDDCGYKTEVGVNGQIVYKQEEYDGFINRYSFLDKLVFTSTRDKYGYQTNLKLTSGNLTHENFTAEYDKPTGNLLSRHRNDSPKEEFGYDYLNRLIWYKPSQGETMKIDYAPNGNVLFKTDVGNYSYDASAKPHAVTEIDNPNGVISSNPLTTTYNTFGKIDVIADSVKKLSTRFLYGPDQDRWYSAQYCDNKLMRSTVYAGNYEEVCEDGNTRGYYYLDGNVIMIRENNTFKPYLAFTDNLGSILSVFDKEGQKVFDASYDAWGKQTITQNDIGLHRGYTGHEMLNEYDIINMNGRLYDPVIGRFFSPDNYVQMPFNSQNFNRYSYCLNNPLKYTDPSGELFGIDDAVIAFAVFNLANSMMQAAYNGQSVWKAGALSLLSSAATYGIGEAFKGVTMTFGNELLRAGAHGISSGVITALDGGNFVSGFASGALASGIGSYAQGVNMNTGLMITSTTAMGGVAAWATGGDFLQGAMQGMTIGMLNHRPHDPINRGRLFRGKNARKQAYNYMKKRSLKTGYELSAAYLENGEVLVFKEKGNDLKTSHSYFTIKDGKRCVDVNGHLVRVTGSVHTHPFVHGNFAPENPLSLSEADFELASKFNYVIDIIVIKSGNGVGMGVYRVSTNGNGLVYPQLIFNF